MTNRLIGSHETGLNAATLTDTEYTAISIVASGTLTAAVSNQFQPSLYCLQAATAGSSGVSYAEIDWGVDAAVIYGMVMVMFPTVPSAITGVIAITDSTPTQLFGIRVNASGFWQVNNNANATVYTSTVYKPVAGVWHRVEFYWKQDAATGEFTIKVDGVADTDLTKTGLNNGTAKPRRLRLGVTEAQTNAPTRYIDHYIVNDNAGSINNTWVGRAFMRALNPNGSVAANWTVVGAGLADWQAMLVRPWDTSTGRMIKSSTANQINTTDNSELGSDSTGLTIIALQALVRHRRAVAGSAAAVTVYLRRASTDDAGQSVDAGNATFTTKRGLLNETDPSTSSAWTKDGVNAVQLKLVHDAGTNEADINAALVYVAAVMSDTVSESIYNAGTITHINLSGKVNNVPVERQPRRGRQRHKVTV